MPPPLSKGKSAMPRHQLSAARGLLTRPWTQPLLGERSRRRLEERGRRRASPGGGEGDSPDWAGFQKHKRALHDMGMAFRRVRGQTAGLPSTGLPDKAALSAASRILSPKNICSSPTRSSLSPPGTCVALLGNKVFAGVIKLRRGHAGLEWGPPH